MLFRSPIWRENLPYILEKYDRWSRYEPETAGVVLAYATMYGNTEAAVHRLAARLADRGVEDIRMFDVSKTHPSFIVAEVFRLSHLVLAAPTYNGGLYYAMDALLRKWRRSTCAKGAWRWWKTAPGHRRRARR